MRPLLTSALLASLALAILPALPHRAEAKTGVLRCKMPDGTSVYTNKACGALGAMSAPMDAKILARIARDQRRERELTALQNGLDPADARADALALVPDVPARRPLASGCATTPAQLALDLQGAVALGDVNRIAESFDWAGMDHVQAQRIMARLQQISRRAVRDSEYFDASIGQGMLFADAGSPLQPDGAAGLLQVTFDAGDGAAIVDFEVRRDEGCYFLRY